MSASVTPLTTIYGEINLLNLFQTLAEAQYIITGSKHAILSYTDSSACPEEIRNLKTKMYRIPRERSQIMYKSIF